MTHKKSSLPQSRLESFTAKQLTDGFASGDFSPVEVIKAILKRIEKQNHYVNAFCLVDQDAAITSARASEKRWLNKQPLSPIDGVPVSIKDLLLTKNWPTRRGSHLINSDPEGGWYEDAPSVARLREAGAVIFGKTTTPELGWKGVTDSPVTGITRNPWNLEKTPGGSSGGSAAAVAWDMGPLSVGTDGGGSVRIPAAFTGIFGLKPTYGRVPLFPASPFGTLAHAGPMTRSVEDAALMMDVLCGFDSRDWSAMPPSESTHITELTSGVVGLRIALSIRLGYVTQIDAEIEKATLAAGKLLEELGATVELVDPPIHKDPVEAFHVLWFAGAAKAVELLKPQNTALMDPGLVDICEQGKRYSASDYLDATTVRMELGKALGTFHETYDLLLTPALPIPAFTAGLEAPKGSVSPRWTSWTPYTYPFNLTQQPAASVPFGRTSEGLPVGIQLVGRRHSDAVILRAAYALEQAFNDTARPADSFPKT